MLQLLCVLLIIFISEMLVQGRPYAQALPTGGTFFFLSFGRLQLLSFCSEQCKFFVLFQQMTTNDIRNMRQEYEEERKGNLWATQKCIYAFPLRISIYEPFCCVASPTMLYCFKYCVSSVYTRIYGTLYSHVLDARSSTAVWVPHVH